MSANEVKKPVGWKLFIFRVVLVLFPVIILAVLEGILRIAGAGREIPLFIEDPGNNEYLHINNRIAERYFLDPGAAPGVRYPSFLKEKPENGLRIVVQGASTVAGIPYKKGGAFPAMLEYRLRRAFPDKEVEVVNTGITAVCSYTLLDLADDIMEIEPDAVIVYAGHNEYYGVLGVGSSQRLGSNNGLIRFYHSMNKLRLVRVIRKAHGAISGRKTAHLISKPNSTLMERMVKEQQIPLDTKLYEQGVNQFRVNLNRLAGKYRKQHIPLLVCTLVSNEKDLEPFIGSVPGDPNGADTQYSLGQEFYREGEFEKAKNHLVRASDLDMLRFRAPSAFNRVIREVAEKQDAYMVDVRQEFEEHSPHGIIGEELLTEHVHPNIRGNSLIARTCLDALIESGVVEDGTTAFPGNAETDLPVTEVDSLYGVIGIRLLKNSWPFRESPTGPDRILELFTPISHIDSMALDLFLEKRTWEETMNLLYRYYMAAGQYGKALTVASALQIEIRYSGIPYNMAGRVYSEMGDYGRACSELKKGFDMDPIPHIAYNLGNNLILAGKVTRSIPYLEFFLEANPGRKDVDEKLAVARRIKEIEGEMATSPDSTELYIHMAYQYLLLNQRKPADSLVGAAYRRDPRNELLNQIFSGSQD